MSLSNTELSHIADFLEQLGNIQGNAGCNDFEMPATEENIKMCQEFEAAEGHDISGIWGIRSGKILTMDWWITAHLEKKIRKMLNDTSR